MILDANRPLFIGCPGCGSMGGRIDPILEDGSGPWEECGYCEGSGFVDRIMWGAVMQWLRNPDWEPHDEADWEKRRLEALRAAVARHGHPQVHLPPYLNPNRENVVAYSYIEKKP